jgi:hypothetical protein
MSFKYKKFYGIMAATFTPFDKSGKNLNLSIIETYAKDLIK